MSDTLRATANVMKKQHELQNVSEAASKLSTGSGGKLMGNFKQFPGSVEKCFNWEFDWTIVEVCEERSRKLRKQS
jgi:hypothetical protein